MSERVTGRCNCGQYKITMPKGTKMNLCHCTDCRRWAGAMYSAHIVVDEKDLKLEGPEPRTHTVKGIEGVEMLRAWCDTCGSGLYIERVGGKGSNKYIKAGLFEPGDVPKPTFETFTKDMESWESKAEGAEHYEKNIPGI